MAKPRRLARTDALAVLVTTALACGCAPERAPIPASPAPPPRIAPTSVASAPPPEPPASPAPPPACPRITTELPALTEVPGLPPVEVPPIVDASGEAMKGLYEKLARFLRGKATDHVRIAVYGDSNLTKDFITGAMRRTLQGKYGDAGHGFVALARPWSHYRHMDVRHGPKFGFASYAVTTDPVPDHIYGFSGIAAESMQTGAAAWVGTVDSGPVGRHVGRVGVFYLKRPGYGRFSVQIDGAEQALIDTDSPDVAAVYRTFSVAEGPHVADFVAAGTRRVRLLGAVLESATPGIVVDSLGCGALNTLSMWHEDAAVNRAMLRSRPYDLVVFTTGTNDFLQMDAVPGWLSDVIETHRSAMPGVSILLASPPDRGQGKSSKPIIAVGRQRREIAEKTKTAFWDLWASMGGEGAMTRWHELGLGIKWDYIHLSETGGAYLGQRLVYAIWRDFMAYAERHPEIGCDPASPAGGPAPP